jgi:DNA-binding transcriptional regulator YiaG
MRKSGRTRSAARSLRVPIAAAPADDPRAALVAWRKRLGMSQPEAAAALLTPQATYKNWEQGRNPPPPAIKLACELIEQRAKEATK